MRAIATDDLNGIYGGWHVSVDFGAVEFEFSGEEIYSGYNWCVGQMSDFFTWWDPAGYYEASGC